MRAHLDWSIPVLAVGLTLGITAACGSDDSSGGNSKGGGGTSASGGGGKDGGKGGSGGSGNTSGTGGSGNAGGSGGVGNSGGAAGTGGAAGNGGQAGSVSGGGGSGGVAGNPSSGGTGGGSGKIPPDKQNLRVAFLGDTSSATNFKSVLGLIKAENADFTLGLGDYDYSANPSAWITTLTSVVGSSYPVFGAVGNHDAGTWGPYITEFKKRMSQAGITPDDPDFTDQKFSAVYHGLKLVFVGENGQNTSFASYLQSQLATDDHLWKICLWHKNQAAMQVGAKTDEMGWDVYENCRKAGALVATAHEHTYHRTKTLTSLSNQIVDTTCSDPNKLCVGPGRTFVFVSGLGGNSIRDQNRCLPTSYPYGCKGEWAFIFTSNQNAEYGALFINFYVNGDPKKAHGYFKTISNKTVDQFDITLD